MNPSQESRLVAVAGATGKLGRLVIDALLTHPGVRVRALVRDPNKAEALSLRRDGVELFPYDASTSDETLHDGAVRGAFAIVSALQGGPDIIVDGQLALLRAARRANARRFIPSDFSYNIFSLPAGTNLNSDWRRDFAEQAREARGEVEVVHVMQGIFADPYVLGFLGLFDAERGLVRYWGDGRTPIDWTTWEDTARFTAAAALDDRAVPERLFVAGDRMDVLAFAHLWGATHGRPVTLERLGSLPELEAEVTRRLASEPGNMYAWLPLMYARGVFGGHALLGELHNGRYPEIAPESVAAVMARGAL